MQVELTQEARERFVSATIDFRPQQGFRLLTPQQFLAYGIHLKERWA